MNSGVIPFEFVNDTNLERLNMDYNHSVIMQRPGRYDPELRYGQLRIVS